MTVTFWSIVSAMTLAVLGLVLRPLFMRQPTVTNDQEKNSRCIGSSFLSWNKILPTVC